MRNSISPIDIPLYIERYENGESVSSIAKEIGCHYQTLYKALKGKINFRGRWVTTHKERSDIIDLFRKGHPSEEIGRIMGVNGETIRNYLKKLIPDEYATEIVRRDQRGAIWNITINDNLFKNLKDEAAAYALGWITSDGNLNTNRPGDIRIFYHKNDIEMSAQFKKIFNGGKDSIFQSHPNMVDFRLYSKELRKDLEKIGLTENKSLSLEIKEKWPNINVPAFLRGLFEGDGWVTLTKTNGIQVGIASASFIFVGQLIELLVSMGFSPTKERRTNMEGRNSECKGIHLGKFKEAVRFLNLIYKDANYFLSRKRNKYLNFIANNPAYKDENFLNSELRNLVDSKYNNSLKKFPLK